MAKKAKKAAKKPGPRNQFVPADTMPADKLKYTLDLVTAISKGKKNGFVFVSEVGENGTKTHIEGVAYMQKVSQLDVAEAIIASGAITPMAFVEAIKEHIMRGGGMSGHKHDAHGNCIN